MFFSYYVSPIGKIKILSDGDAIKEMYFDETSCESVTCPIIDKTKEWLNDYFACNATNTLIKINPEGTQYQKNVWLILRDIPYGEYITYGQLAEKYFQTFGIKTSARAIARAVSKNKIAILIPCHRVLGANFTLVGYAWGLNKKRALLNLERVTFKA